MDTRAYFELMRPLNCIMAGAAVFAGFAVAYGEFAFPPALLLAVFSVFAICGAGQAINDYYDAEIDAKLNPKKPIPSGRVNIKGARNFAVVLFASGILVSLFINLHAFAIAAVYSVMLFVYSKGMRNYKFLGNWIVALGTALTLVYGASITQNYGVVVYLAACALFANVGREIIKDMEDMPCERGYKRTLPMILPGKSITHIVFLLYCASVIIAFVVWALGIVQGVFYLMLIVLAAAAFYYSFDYLVRGKPADAQIYGKYAMAAALLAFLAGIAG